MIKIESFEQYVEITKHAMARKLRNINCFLMPDEIKKLIEKQEIFYIENENVLQLIIKKDRHTKVFWYSNENFEFLPFEESLEIVTDLPFSVKMSERYIEFANKLKKTGFEINSTNSRMCASVDDYDKNIKNIGNLKIIPMREFDIDDVYNLWEENFDPLMNYLYSKKEITELETEVYVCLNEKDKFVGAMELTITNTYGMVSKIAVAEEYKGCGIGSIMEDFYIKRCKSLGIKNLLLYTIDTNVGAINFHQKFGFKYDGKYNHQYIYRRKSWKD